MTLAVEPGRRRPKLARYQREVAMVRGDNATKERDANGLKRVERFLMVTERADLNDGHI
jgi:hypothetical protein